MKKEGKNYEDVASTTESMSNMALNDIVVPTGGESSIHDQPYMGTKDKLATVTATVPSATDLETLYAEYKDYKLLRKKDEMQSS